MKNNPFVVGMLLMGFALGLIVLAVSAMSLGDSWSTASEEWIEVPCEVVSTSYEERNDSRPGRYRGSFYVPTVNYKYQVDGQTYFSDRYARLDPSYKRVEDLENAIAEMKLVRHCFVDPNAPQNAMIKKGKTSKSLIAVLPMASVLFAVTVLVLFTKK